MNFRRFFLASAVSLAVFFISYAAYADNAVNLLISGEKALTEPYIHEGDIMLPARELSEKLGFEVLWDEKSRCASFFKDGALLTIDTKNNMVLKNSTELLQKSSVEFKDGRIFLPLNTVSEGFDCSALYSSKTKTVSIKQGDLSTFHFLYAGQADCVFIELPDNRCMLVDSGTAAFSETLVSYIEALGYTHIDYVVATHPHADHIGSMPEILERFSVGKFFLPNIVHTTMNFEKMLDALLKNGCECVFLSRGMKVFDGDASCLALAPSGDSEKSYAKMNDYSIVLRIDIEKVSFLLSADAEAVSEFEMINSGVNLNADILKVGHHGSSTSSTESYISLITPEAGIISVGKNNKYGFPSDEVVSRLKYYGADIYRTDLDGNIKVVTDGYIYTISKER